MTVVRLLGTGITVLFLTWTFTFGGLGSLVARAAGRSGWAGFALGFLLGPIGWLLVLPHKHWTDDARRQAPIVAHEARDLAGEGIARANQARHWSTATARRRSAVLSGQITAARSRRGRSTDNDKLV